MDLQLDEADEREQQRERHEVVPLPEARLHLSEGEDDVSHRLGRHQLHEQRVPPPAPRGGAVELVCLDVPLVEGFVDLLNNRVTVEDTITVVVPVVKFLDETREVRTVDAVVRHPPEQNATLVGVAIQPVEQLSLIVVGEDDLNDRPDRTGVDDYLGETGDIDLFVLVVPHGIPPCFDGP